MGCDLSVRSCRNRDGHPEFRDNTWEGNMTVTDGGAMFRNDGTPFR